MFAKRNIKLGTILGIPVLLNPSWFLMAIPFTALLAWGVYPDRIADRPESTYVLMALATMYFFFMSMLFHELAHGVVAKAFRIPVRSITLLFIGGVAEVTREAKRPIAELLMALAGPLMSFAIGACCWYAQRSANHADQTPIDLVLAVLAGTNIFLGIFNLLPAFPMDGGRVFRSLLWLVMRDQTNATSVAAWVGRLFGWVFLAVGIVAVLGKDVRVYDIPIAEGWTGIWPLLVGFFLENASRQSLFQNRVVQELRQYAAKDLMLMNPPIVDVHMSIGSLARGIIDLNPRVCYFVEEDGRLAGILSAYQIRSIDESMWDSITAGDAMVPTWRLHAVPPERPVSEVLVDMERTELTHLPVVVDGDVVGTIGRDRILGVLQQAGFLDSA